MHRTRSTRDKLDDRRALEPRQALQSSVSAALQRVILFHDVTGTFYRSWSDKVRDEKARLMLQHLAGLEAQRAATLREYESIAPKEVLETWLKVGPEIEVTNWLAEIGMNSRVSVYDVSEIAGKLFDLLLKILETQVSQSESEEVRNLLRHLRDDESRAKLYALRSTELD
jgi:rubrerythrin